MRLGLYIRGAYIVVKSSIFFFSFWWNLVETWSKNLCWQGKSDMLTECFLRSFFPSKIVSARGRGLIANVSTHKKNLESGLSNEPTEALARYSRTTLKALVTSKFSSFLPGGLQRQFGICTHVCVCVFLKVTPNSEPCAPGQGERVSQRTTPWFLQQHLPLSRRFDLSENWLSLLDFRDRIWVGISILIHTISHCSIWTHVLDCNFLGDLLSSVPVQI